MVWFHQCLFKMFKVTVYFPVGKDTAIITFGESIRIYHIIYIIYIHMCVSVCIYIYIYMHTYLQGDLKQIQEIQPTVMDIFPVVNQKKTSHVLR